MQDTQVRNACGYLSLSGRMNESIYPRTKNEERLNERSGLQRKHEDENGAKQNKRNIRGRRRDICKPNAHRIQVRATCG